MKRKRSEIHGDFLNSCVVDVKGFITEHRSRGRTCLVLAKETEKGRAAGFFVGYNLNVETGA